MTVNKLTVAKVVLKRVFEILSNPEIKNVKARWFGALNFLFAHWHIVIY